MIFVAISPSNAGGRFEPPVSGYQGILWSAERSRGEMAAYGCASLDLVKILYEAGKDDPRLVASKYNELRAQAPQNYPPCILGIYGKVEVTDPAVELGPMANPAGNVKIFVWALPIEVSAVKLKLWIFYVGAKLPKPIRSQAG